MRVTETTKLTATLQPQTLATHVDVQAQIARVETTTAVTGQSLTSNTITTLPLATQNFQQLLTLSAGTASNLNASASCTSITRTSMLRSSPPISLALAAPTTMSTTLFINFTFNSSGFQIGPTPGADQTQDQNNLILLNTTSWANGKHLIRFGGEFDRMTLAKIFPQVFNGQLFFSPGTSGAACAAGCSDFQEFLLGAPAFTYGGSGVANHEYRIADPALFGQDDYKVGPNLTLNLRLRWEFNGAVTDNLRDIGNTIPSLTFTGQNPFVYPTCVNNLNVPGLVGTRNATTLNNNYASNWARDSGLPTTYSARALHQFAAGIPGQMGTIFASSLPEGGVIDPAYVPVYSRLQGFVDAQGNPTRDTTQTPVYTGNSEIYHGLEVPTHYVNPSTQQWNISLQQSLGRGWVLEAAGISVASPLFNPARLSRHSIQRQLRPMDYLAQQKYSL